MKHFTVYCVSATQTDAHPVSEISTDYETHPYVISQCTAHFSPGELYFLA